jgi:SpoVK/Ycf46/Vps4 family AAA+-type ATPase
MPLSAKDFEEALAKIHPTVSQTDIGAHQKWMSEFGAS